ncbi:MAG TPA: Omp28-related outer membrane protein, partial [Chitinophagales bacterium]|nr:Omp28-related outer membrane protein [Chitinophagales bacterium]
TDKMSHIFTVSPQTKDFAVTNVSLLNYIFAGSNPITGTLQNLGATTVNYFTLNYRINSGPVQTQSISASIAPGAGYNFTHSIPWLADYGNHTVEVWASNLDGMADMNPNNDKQTKSVFAAFELANRTVMIEHFTQASCGPCAAQNPALQSVLTQPANAGKYARISYHTSWPGTDPMYNQSSTDSDARVSFYGISGVPSIIVEGTRKGAPSIVTTSLINQLQTLPSILKVTLQESLSGNTATINVTIQSFANMQPGNYRLHIAITEQMVSYTTAPGSNGEKNFPDVFRKLLPTGGTILPALSAGQTFTFSTSYTFPTFVNASNLRTVVFVQNTGTKEILQTYKSPAATGFNSLAATATLTAPGVRLRAKVLLEGAFNLATGAMNTTLQMAGVIPNLQPYSGSPWNYGGNENVLSFPANIVDWVLLELRDASLNTLARRAAFVRNDGQLIDVDGSMGVLFTSAIVSGNNYRLAVYHRNHLAALSAGLINLPNTIAYDFSNIVNVSGQGQVNQVATNTYALFTGDCEQNGVITYADFNKFQTQSGQTGYLSGDVNLNGAVNTLDFNLIQNNASRIT